ncbi:MAG: hypothetical protein LCH32_03985 [Bacteroidetes bacterium]|nr:hypothetical protein [Bacteroidota bacterium]
MKELINENQINVNNVVLQPINKEFSEALTFCWHLRQGFSFSIDKYRLKLYTDWFFNKCLTHHFAFEEEFIFSQIQNNKDAVHKAKSYQRKLKRLFSDQINLEKSISLIEEELEAYVRFEKHKIYKIVVDTIPNKQLNKIMELYKENIMFEDWNDPFWKTIKNK